MTAAYLQERRNPDPPPLDEYPTPPDVTRALLLHLQLPPGTVIWEPACGDGHMLRVLEAAGLQVIGTDLKPNPAGRGRVNFLHAPTPRGAQWIITNPPFTHAEAFVRRALTHQLPVAFLLKSQFWHAARRHALFTDHQPAEILPLTWRPDFHATTGKRGGNPVMECSWTLWNPQPALRTAYLPLPRP